jgi:hypothetical protein
MKILLTPSLALFVLFTASLLPTHANASEAFILENGDGNQTYLAQRSELVRHPSGDTDSTGNARFLGTSGPLESYIVTVDTETDYRLWDLLQVAPIGVGAITVQETLTSDPLPVGHAAIYIEGKYEPVVQESEATETSVEE